MLVLSASAADVASLGSISLTFGSLGAVNFTAGNFYTNAQTGFPASIGGIANGAVNGIKFPGSLHAAVDLDFGRTDLIALLSERADQRREDHDTHQSPR